MALIKTVLIISSTKAPPQIVNGLVQALQDRPYRHGFSAPLHRFISDIPGV